MDRMPDTTRHMYCIKGYSSMYLARAAADKGILAAGIAIQ